MSVRQIIDPSTGKIALPYIPTESPQLNPITSFITGGTLSSGIDTSITDITSSVASIAGQGNVLAGASLLNFPAGLNATAITLQAQINFQHVAINFIGICTEGASSYIPPPTLSIGAYLKVGALNCEIYPTQGYCIGNLLLIDKHDGPYLNTSYAYSGTITLTDFVSYPLPALNPGTVTVYMYILPPRFQVNQSVEGGLEDATVNMETLFDGAVPTLADTGLITYVLSADLSN